jgi:hypothetical protein
MPHNLCTDKKKRKSSLLQRQPFFLSVATVISGQTFRSVREHLGLNFCRCMKVTKRSFLNVFSFDIISFDIVRLFGLRDARCYFVLIIKNVM